MRRELPDAIDLLTISVESGLGFDAALPQVARNTSGPWPTSSPGCCRRCRSVSAAPSVAGSRRTDGPARLRSFISAMVQADSFGIPVAQVPRVQARRDARQAQPAGSRARPEVPGEFLLPLIFCILPSLFVAILGPAGIFDHGQLLGQTSEA